MFGETLCSQKHFNLSAETTINVFNAARPRVTWAIFVLKNNRIRFPWYVAKGFLLLKRHKSQFIVLPIYPLPWQVFLKTKVCLCRYWERERSKLLRLSAIQSLLFEEQKPTTVIFGGDGTYCCWKKTSHDYKKEKISPFLEKLFRQSQSATPKSVLKKAKMRLWHIRVDFPLADTVNEKFISNLISKIFSLRYSSMVFQSATKTSSFLLTSVYCKSDFKRPPPRNKKMLLKNSFSMLQILVFSKTRLFEPPYRVIANYRLLARLWETRSFL